MVDKKSVSSTRRTKRRESPEILTKPLPQILDEMQEHIKAAEEAARKSEEAEKGARESASAAVAAAEHAAEEAARMADEAAAKAEDASLRAEGLPLLRGKVWGRLSPQPTPLLAEPCVSPQASPC